MKEIIETNIKINEQQADNFFDVKLRILNIVKSSTKISIRQKLKIMQNVYLTRQ